MKDNEDQNDWMIDIQSPRLLLFYNAWREGQSRSRIILLKRVSMTDMHTERESLADMAKVGVLFPIRTCRHRERERESLTDMAKVGVLFPIRTCRHT